ncbi:apolipoprotein N-acyltransferase [Allosaccharopolyspora coralli]|uniref:Apolipoprotein N-acyltransferase n=1 Tax=Allosaccharopolyspora coralli TaxID=2665642 RepID=A0A5Q3QL96_9PSEU|nr:apolipoprotein N-acyltransferase [Allosaccharopolyspora coralli]
MPVAVLAGSAIFVASPPRNLWWLVPFAVAALALVVRGRRAGAGFGHGLLFGFAAMLPMLGWLQDFLSDQFGPWPWLGVALVQAAFFGLAGAGMARVSVLRGAPVWMAAVFLVAEMLRSAIPFGGFPWGRLAFTQPEGAMTPWAAVGGAGLVTFLVAVVGTAIGEFVARIAGGRRRLAAPAVLAIAPVALGLAMWPLVGTEAQEGTAKVAVVQGNAPDVGLDLLYEDDVLRDNHMRALRDLADDVRAGQVQRPDVVVLPEQVGSWGPQRSDPELAAATADLGVPVVVGGLGRDADGEIRNRILAWEPERGPTQDYVKRHLVPFAEAIPLRPLASMVTPFVDRFPQDMVAGDRPGVFDVGGAKIGLGLCFDVAYDDVFLGAAREGATMFAVPTNNAWYGRSEMSYQHLAMSQFRAVEHGRAVVVAATSGVSAIIDPDGTLRQQTRQFTPDVLVADVPLRSSTTPATVVGSVPAYVLATIGVAALLWTFRRRTAAN